MSTLRSKYYSITHSESANFLSRPMTLDGVPTGDNSLVVNGSITPVEFYVTPAENQIFDIATINIVIADNSAAGVSDYGSIAGPLANGVIFFVEVEGVKQDISYAFKSNADFAKESSSFDKYEMGSNARVILYKEMFLEYTRGKLKIPYGSKFGVRVRDDLTGLLLHTCQVKGTILKIDPTF